MRAWTKGETECKHLFMNVFRVSVLPEASVFRKTLCMWAFRAFSMTSSFQLKKLGMKTLKVPSAASPSNCFGTSYGSGYIVESAFSALK